MNKPIVAWISLGIWMLSAMTVFVTQGNSIANAVTLVLSAWLVSLGWYVNRKQKSMI
ncbi:MAG: hypothetical protein JSV42_02995 [Chloroflexota bacterium]|nr:MAG: hypothetical protein JSV42_02995 [Chloroflexota bacterium]